MFHEKYMIMLQVNELMIGDWVLIKDYPIKALPKKVRPEHFVRSLVEFESIPITSEILEKNGFVAEGDNFKMWTSADKRVILHNNDGYLNTFNKWHVHVDTEDMRTIGCVELTYVHQFQQFLRLCGMNELADNFKI